MIEFHLSIVNQQYLTMPNILISDLKSGNTVNQVFLVQKSEVRTTKTGSFYITAQLADRTGTIAARVWNASNDQIDIFGGNDILNVKGRVESFQNNLQLIVDTFSTVDESTLDLQTLLPSTDKDVMVLMAELKEMLFTTKNPHILQLFTIFFEDDEFCKKLSTAPAAVQYHHAYLGGLLEHIVSVLKLATSILPNYPEMDKDLLFAGIFFHDIGKVKELSYSKAFKYTDEGMLIGHLISGVKMINEKVRQIKDFPDDLLHVIEHLVLSHHGEYEWGSPKLPMTVEAIALHYLDNLDAKIFAFNKAITNDNNPNSNWTEYNRMFERRLYKK
ncbi:MAG: 3'-5' exoribonuclease YhaM family protein [Candidatus Anammoxibacter sp.]